MMEDGVNEVNCLFIIHFFDLLIMVSDSVDKFSSWDPIKYIFDLLTINIVIILEGIHTAVARCRSNS